MLLGVGVGEIIWETQGERALPRLKVWHPRWLRWDWEKRQWLLAVDGGKEVAIEPGSNKWVLYTPAGSYRPWSHGAWRACAQPWLMKQLAIQDWARHSEVHGSPIRVGTAPEGASAEVRQQVAHDFQRLGSDTAICLPAGFDLRFAEASGGSWQMFKAELDWANTELAIALAGQNLTSEVSGGSYAAASVHQAIRQDLIEADARTLSTCLREQVVRWWAEYNLGRAELAPWPEWETEAPQSVQGTAQALGAIAQAVGALKQVGVEVDSRALLERTGVGVVGGEATALSQAPVMLFDPSQPRDWHGRWTRYLEGEGGGISRDVERGSSTSDASSETGTGSEIEKTGSSSADHQRLPSFSEQQSWFATQQWNKPSSNNGDSPYEQFQRRMHRAFGGLKGELFNEPGFNLFTEAEKTRLKKYLAGPEPAATNVALALREEMNGTLNSVRTSSEKAEVYRKAMKTGLPHLVNGLPPNRVSSSYKLAEPTIVKEYKFPDGVTQANVYRLKIGKQDVPIYSPRFIEPFENLPAVKQVADAIASLPPGERRLIKKVVISPGTKAVGKGDQDKAPQVAMDSGSDGTLTVYATRYTRTDIRTQNELQHEVGHFVSFKKLGTNYKEHYEPDWADAPVAKQPSSTPSWDAWIAAAHNDNFFASGYATRSPVEDFAEVYHLYTAVKGTDQEQRYRERMPERFGLLDRIVDSSKQAN